MIAAPWRVSDPFHAGCSTPNPSPITPHPPQSWRNWDNRPTSNCKPLTQGNPTHLQGEGLPRPPLHRETGYQPGPVPPPSFSPRATRVAQHGCAGHQLRTRETMRPTNIPPATSCSERLRGPVRSSNSSGQAAAREIAFFTRVVYGTPTTRPYLSLIGPVGEHGIVARPSRWRILFR